MDGIDFMLLGFIMYLHFKAELGRSNIYIVLNNNAHQLLFCFFLMSDFWLVIYNMKCSVNTFYVIIMDYQLILEFV